MAANGVAEREVVLSRMMTRVTIDSPLRKTPYHPGVNTRTSQLGLTMPARMTGSRLSRPKKPFNPEDDYSFDSTDDEDEQPSRIKRASPKIPATRGANVYRKLCTKYGKVPVKNVLREFGKAAISIKRSNLSAREFKSFFIALVEQYLDDHAPAEEGVSDSLTSLNLDGNIVGSKQMMYVIDFAASHRPLVELSLRKCGLCSKGLKQLASYFRAYRTVTTLDLSDNNLTDRVVDGLTDIIENGESIHTLVLRGNKLGDCGAQIGEALVNNDTLRHLDLSWNHIRGPGAIGICKGIQKNHGLETLILAWNGFGFEGSTAMGYALAENTTLLSLDLSNNRIHPPALFEFIKGLEKSKTLTNLKLGNNPITASMSSVLLTKIYLAKESNLKELDLEGIVVDKEFDGILEQIQNNRMFIVRYDMSLPLNKGPITNTDPKNVFNIDPIRILYYMKEHLRTLDLFLKVDTDGDQRLSREEMKYAFEMEGFPISEKALDSVMGYLDVNKDGEVDLIPLYSELSRLYHKLEPGYEREFMNGERRLKRQVIKEHEDQILQEKEQDQKYSQVFKNVRKEKNRTPTPQQNQQQQQQQQQPQPTPRKLPPLNKPKLSGGNL